MFDESFVPMRKPHGRIKSLSGGVLDMRANIVHESASFEEENKDQERRQQIEAAQASHRSKNMLESRSNTGDALVSSHASFCSILPRVC